MAPSTPPSPLVLVVEDDQVNQMLLAEVCRNEGYDVLTACDGEAALSVFLEQDVDVVLVDAAMPRMDGLTLCRFVRGLSDVPMIMVTASMEAGMRERAMEAGVSAFVSKPFRLYELTRHIRSALSSRVRPSDPPVGRAHRRTFAKVLDRLETSLRLRSALSRSLGKQVASACLVVRLENEDAVVVKVGRSARDALLGFVGQGLEAILDGVPLYWAESNELAVVVAEGGLDDLIHGVEDVLEGVRGFGIDGVQFRYGAVRYRGDGRVDSDSVLRTARDVLEEAGHRGDTGATRDLGSRGELEPPQREGSE